MIDLGLLRQDPERIIQQIHKKDPAFDVEQLIALDKQVRLLSHEVEQLQHKKNELADARKRRRY